MIDATVVLTGQVVTGPHGDGVNAYLYRRDDVSGEMVLVSRFETREPGGNRVLAALEVLADDESALAALLNGLETSELSEGEHVVHGCAVRVLMPGGAQAGADDLQAIIEAFEMLIHGRGTTPRPLRFVRASNDDEYVYRLDPLSWQRVHQHLSDMSFSPTVRISRAVYDAFNETHGPFEEHLALTALPELTWQRLARLGGYIVIENGSELYRWPRFEAA